MSSCANSSMRSLPGILLVVAGGLCCSGFSSAGASPLPEISHGWTWAPTGTGIGWTGMSVGDFDGDGNLEILADSSGGAIWGAEYWFILEDVSAGRQIRHVSLPLAGQLRSLSAEQLDTDAALEIVLLEDSRLSVLDGATLEVQSTFDLGLPEVLDLEFGDLDGDFALELVVTTLHDLHVFDAATGIPLRTGLGLGGYSLDIGQADSDPDLEIAVASMDELGLVFDGSSLEIQCHLGPYVGTQIAFAELDDDDDLELVAARRGVGGIRAFDSSSCGSVWEIPIWEVDTFAIGDLEGDGREELIYADSQSGPVHVLDLMTQEELWSVWNPLSGVLRIALGDLNHDGESEIVFGGGHYSTGPDRLLIIDPALQTIEWESVDMSGATFGLDAADIDGDGEMELVAGALFSESTYAGGRYLALNALTGRAEYLSESKSSSMWRLAVADVNDDGRVEICFASGNSNQGSIACDDWSTHAEIWQAPLGSGQRAGALRAADLDGDGEQNLVVSTVKSDSSGAGVFVRAYEGQAGIWTSPNLASGYFASLDLMRVGQVDDDRVMEVVVADSATGNVYILDGGSGNIQSSGPAPGIVALDLVDLDRDGRFEVAWAPRNGELKILDAETWILQKSLGPYSSLDTFLFRELTKDAAPELLLSAGGILRIWDGESAKEIWESPGLGTRAGAFDSMVVFGPDSRGAQRIAVNLAYGLAVFDVGPVRIFCGGFETGDRSEWQGGAS